MTVLDLSLNKIGDKGAGAVADALKVLTLRAAASAMAPPSPILFS